MALSLHIARVTGGAGFEALQPGAVVPAAVRVVEDHGYSLSFGIKVGFLWPWLKVQQHNAMAMPSSWTVSVSQQLAVKASQS